MEPGPGGDGTNGAGGPGDDPPQLARPGPQGGRAGDGSHVLSMGSPARDQRSTMPELTLGPESHPMPRVTFSEVDDPGARARYTPYCVRRHQPSFQLRFDPADLHLPNPPPSTLSGVTRTSSTVGTLRSAAGERLVFPQLPVRSLAVVGDGEVVIVSNSQINREIWSYTHACWARCRDGRLPVRECVSRDVCLKAVSKGGGDVLNGVH